MGYYIRHTIYLQDSNEEKLIYITELLHLHDADFIITEETVYDDNGDPISVRCISDANWNCGSGYKWPDLYYNMQQVSEHFNQKYPDEEIRMYIRTEDNYEATLAFLYGSQIRESKIYHYRNELDSICLELEEKQSNEYLELYKVHIIHQHPIVLHQEGAYVMIGFNVFEHSKIVSRDNTRQFPLNLITGIGTTTTSNSKSRLNRCYSIFLLIYVRMVELWNIHEVYTCIFSIT